jgi:hypothetical protein
MACERRGIIQAADITTFVFILGALSHTQKSCCSLCLFGFCARMLRVCACVCLVVCVFRSKRNTPLSREHHLSAAAEQIQINFPRGRYFFSSSAGMRVIIIWPFKRIYSHSTNICFCSKMRICSVHRAGWRASHSGKETRVHLADER